MLSWANSNTMKIAHTRLRSYKPFLKTSQLIQLEVSWSRKRQKHQRVRVYHRRMRHHLKVFMVEHLGSWISPASRPQVYSETLKKSQSLPSLLSHLNLNHRSQCSILQIMFSINQVSQVVSLEVWISTRLDQPTTRIWRNLEILSAVAAVLGRTHKVNRNRVHHLVMTALSNLQVVPNRQLVGCLTLEKET